MDFEDSNCSQLNGLNKASQLFQEPVLDVTCGFLIGQILFQKSVQMVNQVKVGKIYCLTGIIWTFRNGDKSQSIP